MAIKGSFGDLQSLKNDLKALSSDSFKRGVNQELQELSLELIDRGFKHSEDPYGNEWLPLKVRIGMPLIDTGRLRSGFGRGKADSKTFEISNPTPYTALQQYGKILKNGKFPIFKDGGGRGGGMSRLGKSRVAKWVSYDIAEVPARQMVPEDPDGLPQKWLEEYNKIVDRLLKKRMHNGS